MRIEGVSKHFGAARALDDVTFDVEPGRVHGLVGHNGSGKSTLMRVLTGFYEPDAGSVTPGGHVAAIHQDLCLRDDMTVVENFGISTGYSANTFAPVSWRAQRRLAAESLAALGVDADPRRLVGELSPAEKAAVAIARAVSEIRRSGGAGVLIVDEATAYFSQREISVVRGILRRLAADGHSVIFISHNLGETLETCDEVTVLRNGRVVDTFVSAEVDESTIVSAMLGRSLDAYYPPRADVVVDADRPPMLSVSALTDEVIHDFSLDVHAGEVVGVTGLMGTGFDRVPYLLAGMLTGTGGSMTIDGSSTPFDPVRSAGAGMSIVPADRARFGLWMDASATWNYSMPRLGDFWKQGRLDRRSEKRAAVSAMAEFGVIPAEPGLTMASFSGGNAQKVLIASRLEPGVTKVLILHEPTQGVDSGAKVEILRLVQDAALDGAAVVVFSSDHEELVNTCSRVLILDTGGRTVAELPTAELDEDSLVAACIAAG